MSSLFPNFKTFLFQGKGVTGEVPFIKFDTDLKGLYLPATFTRPNSPEDPTESGATVIDADGTIRKLAEDEAPWSYPEGGAANGCLRLINLPEKSTLLPYATSNFDQWNDNNAGINVNVSAKDCIIKNETAFDFIPTTSNGQHRRFKGGLGNGVTGRFYVIAESNGYDYLSLAVGGGLSGGDSIFDIKNGVISTSGNKNPKIISIMRN